MPVIVLIEIEPSQIVVSGSEMWRQPDHLAILLDGSRNVLPLLCCLCLRIQLLHLWRDFIILRLRMDRSGGDAEEEQRSRRMRKTMAGGADFMTSALEHFFYCEGQCSATVCLLDSRIIE